MPTKPKQPAPAKPRKARFVPVPTRQRHDGWTPDRQREFIEALAASACVEEACQTVAMSTASAYRLRQRLDAQPFRLAWDAALDFAVRRLGDAVLARALHGIPVPHYYQGAQVGEHRRYDNRLAMFLLRYRDPLRYAATLDQMVYSGDPEGAALRLARLGALVASGREGFDPDAMLDPPYATEPVPTPAALRAEAELERAEQETADRAAREAEGERCMEEFLRVVGVNSAAGPRDYRPVLNDAATLSPTPDAPPGKGEPRVTWR